MSIAKHILLLLEISILLFIFGCNNRLEHTAEYDQEQIDSISQEISRLYQINPDTLPQLKSYYESTYKSSNIKPVLIQYYSALSEYYQYIKPDNYMALSYLNKATNIILELPDYTETNPYIYINAGNVLSKQNFQIHAVNAYKTAYQLAKTLHPQDTNAIVTSLDNIAQSYQKRRLCDSANIFYSRAERYLKSSNKIQKAIHNNYRASHALICHQKNKIPYYAKTATNLLNESLNEKQFQQPTTQDIIHKELAKSNALIAKYYASFSKDSAIHYYEEALALSNQFENKIERTEYVLDYAKFLNQIEAYQTANIVLKNQLNSLSSGNNYRTKVKLLYAICDNYTHLGQNEKSTDYLFSCKFYQDSLIKQNANENHRNMEFELARLETDIVMNQLNKDLKNKESQLVKYRKTILLTISLLLIIIGFSLYLFTHKKLLSTQKILTKRTISAINKENLSNSTHELKYKDEYIAKLEHLMEEEKVFTNPNLRQEDLAKHLNTNLSYISKLFNTHYKIRFNDYINEYRIKEACKIIASKPTDSYSIDQLYDMVGFKTRSTFYNAFKKFTGSSPAMYIKLNSKG